VFGGRRLAVAARGRFRTIQVCPKDPSYAGWHSPGVSQEVVLWHQRSGSRLKSRLPSLWARADRKIIQKLAKSEHRFARSVEADLASFSAKRAQRRPRPPRPCPLPPSPPNAKGASPRACLCFVAALGQGMADGIEPGPARPQLMVKASLDGSPRSPPIPIELSRNYARTQ
jgi:hypothetical protein